MNLRTLGGTILLAWNYTILYVTQVNPIEANKYLETILLFLSIIATVFHIVKNVKLSKPQQKKDNDNVSV
jgi:hypothetical protein